MGQFYDNRWGMGAGNGLAMFMLMLLFWVLIAAAVFYFIRHSSHSHLDHHAHGPFASPGESPADVVKMRFAKGEIDEEEFAKRLSLLQRDK
jgi:putative membrane protein